MVPIFINYSSILLNRFGCVLTSKEDFSFANTSNHWLAVTFLANKTYSLIETILWNQFGSELDLNTGIYVYNSYFTMQIL